ncbi:MAG: GNAT family N-acetyltransferase [Desulfobacterales bacterium]|nr:GNAT family N-acetyltransferase [Desulfobacterales bacterium]
MKIIKQNDLVIRAIEKEDLLTLKSWNTAEARGEFQEFEVSSYSNLLNSFNKDGFNSERFKILLIERTDSVKIGLIYLNFIREGLLRLGVVLCNSEMRYQGYGLYATRAIVDYLFANYPLVRIEAETDLENIPAQKVLEKAGFQREGVLRSYRFHHGKWHDFVIYSILRI